MNGSRIKQGFVLAFFVASGMAVGMAGVGLAVAGDPQEATTGQEVAAPETTSGSQHDAHPPAQAHGAMDGQQGSHGMGNPNGPGWMGGPGYPVNPGMMGGSNEHGGVRERAWSGEQRNPT